MSSAFKNGSPVYTPPFARFRQSGKTRRPIFAPLPAPAAGLEPIDVLVQMLRTRRPHRSKQEEQFIQQWLLPLPGARQDKVGNVIVVLPQRDGSPSRVLWSSHTDTVHRSGGLQKLTINQGKIALRNLHEDADCLGADCTTGVWIMREMILAGVPGRYVFHRGEECGAEGSRHIASEGKELLDGVEFAIAFDRMRTGSIITHQGGQRCCSEAFSAQLASVIGVPGLKSDNGGTFTDTANYTKLVAECTNVSVGYVGQHTSKETQDAEFALRLREAMLAFDETPLVATRDPTAVENWRSRYSYYDAWDPAESDLVVEMRPPWQRKLGAPTLPTDPDAAIGLTYEEAVSLVESYPEIAIRLLTAHTYTRKAWEQAASPYTDRIQDLFDDL